MTTRVATCRLRGLLRAAAVLLVAVGNAQALQPPEAASSAEPLAARPVSAQALQAKFSTDAALIRARAGSSLAMPATLRDCELESRVLRTDTQLEPGCRYRMSLQIRAPLTLDCRGAVLEGDNRRVAAVYVNSDGKPLRGVTVRNCIIQHYKGSGLTVGWAAWQDDKRRGRTPAQQRALTPQDVTLSNLLVQDIDGAGLFIGDYTTRVTIERVTLRRIAHVGVYFEQAGEGHVLRHSVLQDGGRASNQPAVAIDASGPHDIHHNVFERFALAGVSLYRNCWEQAASNPHSLPRLQGAHGNLIRDNVFSELDVGVWVASRMSRDIRLMGCGLPVFHEEGVRKFVEDDAERNEVRGNLFERIRARPVVIEDDDNAVLGNTFDAPTGPAITVGTPHRARVMKQPVRGARIEGNRLSTGADAPVSLQHDSTPAR